MPNAGENPDPSKEDVMAGEDRRISRPDNSLPDWEMPDTAYRPVPIVWFFSAWLAQTFGMCLIFLVLGQVSAMIALAVSLVLSGLVLNWTWNRGMQEASQAWKIATYAMLGAQFAFAATVVFALK